MNADARTVAITTGTGSNHQIASRTATAGSLTSTTSTSTYTYPDAWVLLERVGNVIAVAVSSDGVTFNEIDTITLTGLGPSVEAGIFSNSGSAGESTRAVFSDYTIILL